jgi:hypothetical protein
VSSGRSVFHVLTPTYRPVGGVVKIMDYAQHARSLGYRVSVWSPEQAAPDSALFQIDRLRPLVSAEDVEFHSRTLLEFGPDDLAFISLPDNYEIAHRSLHSGWSPERIVHIVQNTRHVNPRWRDGYATRLLTRPAARIAINDIVADTIRPWLDSRCLLRVVNLGHDLDHFRHNRTGGLDRRPLRVAYTTWKSAVGDDVARSLAGRDDFEFRAVRETATWDELRDLYVWSDVFLSTPNPQEGMYLPGLEAMAAGSLVITPDVGGNMAYCRPGDNCLLVGFEDVAGYRAALLDLAERDAAQVAKMRQAAYDVTGSFDLDKERAGFASFLEELWPRVRAFESERGA